MKKKSRDVNDILLMAAPFFLKQPLREFANMNKLRQALQTISQDIIQIKPDALDFHKTKQLARVSYVLSARSQNSRVKWIS